MSVSLKTIELSDDVKDRLNITTNKFFESVKKTAAKGLTSYLDNFAADVQSWIDGCVEDLEEEFPGVVVSYITGIDSEPSGVIHVGGKPLQWIKFLSTSKYKTCLQKKKLWYLWTNPDKLDTSAIIDWRHMIEAGVVTNQNYTAVGKYYTYLESADKLRIQMRGTENVAALRSSNMDELARLRLKVASIEAENRALKERIAAPAAASAAAASAEEEEEEIVSFKAREWGQLKYHGLMMADPLKEDYEELFEEFLEFEKKIYDWETAAVPFLRSLNELREREKAEGHIRPFMWSNSRVTWGDFVKDITGPLYKHVHTCWVRYLNICAQVKPGGNLERRTKVARVSSSGTRERNTVYRETDDEDEEEDEEEDDEDEYVLVGGEDEDDDSTTTRKKRRKKRSSSGKKAAPSSKTAAPATSAKTAEKNALRVRFFKALQGLGTYKGKEPPSNWANWNWHWSDIKKKAMECNDVVPEEYKIDMSILDLQSGRKKHTLDVTIVEGIEDLSTGMTKKLVEGRLNRDITAEVNHPNTTGD